MPREAQALTTVDLLTDARQVACPVALLLGKLSPPWARDISTALARTLPDAELVTLPGQGHEAIDSAPSLVVGELQRFFDNRAQPTAHG
jgi:pimeloyl-ACP methyl ester carboxylesterase